MITQVTVDGRQLSGVDRYGDWAVSSIEGWFDSPDRKSKDESRPDADGDFDMQEYWEARHVTIDGRLKAKSHDMLHEAENWLKGMLRGGLGTMLVRGHGPDQWASVKLAAGIKCKPEPGTDDYLRWQLRLKAPDPFKYGESYAPSTTANAPLDVFHRGNADAWPVVTVTGSMPGGYEVMIDGRLLEVLAPLVSGQPHVISTRTRRITVGGSRVYGVLGISEPLHITPGMAQNFYALPKTSGSATFKVAFYDTYI